MILYMGSYYGKGLLKIAISVSKCPYRFEIPFLIVANVKFTGRKWLCDTIPGYFVHQRMFTSIMPDINIKPIRAYYNFQNNSVPFSIFWDLSLVERKSTLLHFLAQLEKDVLSERKYEYSCFQKLTNY